MNAKSIASSRLSRRGLTLVEVVAGLALLATLLVALLLARARYTLQHHTAERRLQAVAAADELLSQWWRQPKTFPRNGAGRTSGPARFAWRTRTLPEETLRPFGAERVRLELFDPASKPAAVVSVDVILSKEALLNVPSAR